MNTITKKILSVFRKVLGVILCLVALLTALQFSGVFEISKDSHRSNIEHAIITAWGSAEKFCKLNGRLPTEFPEIKSFIKVTSPKYVTDISQQPPSDFLKEKVFLLTIAALDPKAYSKNLDGYGASRVDSKMDDGLPNSGKIRFIGQPECLSKSAKGDVVYNENYKDYEADCTAFTIEINCEKRAK